MAIFARFVAPLAVLSMLSMPACTRASKQNSEATAAKNTKSRIGSERELEGYVVAVTSNGLYQTTFLEAVVQPLNHVNVVFAHVVPTGTVNLGDASVHDGFIQLKITSTDGDYAPSGESAGILHQYCSLSPRNENVDTSAAFPNLAVYIGPNQLFRGDGVLCFASQFNRGYGEIIAFFDGDSGQAPEGYAVPASAEVSQASVAWDATESGLAHVAWVATANVPHAVSFFEGDQAPPTCAVGHGVVSSKIVQPSDSSVSFSGLNPAMEYTFRICAIHDGFASPGLVAPLAAEGNSTGLDCSGLPGGIWIPIPANPEVGQLSDFCLMKYEAKNDGSDRPESIANRLPYTNVSRNDARTKCSSLGDGFTLMTNAMWQTVARNLETAKVGNNFVNWELGSQSNADRINRGHSNESPPVALVADDDDQNGCIGLTTVGHPPDNCSGGWYFGKRTHTLSNGEVVWDFAGNVGEFVYDDYLESVGSNVNVAQMTAAAGYDLVKWGAKGNHTTKTSDETRAGLGFAFLNSSANAIVRGGIYSDHTVAGIFTTTMGNDADYVPGEAYGFRCAYVVP